MLRAGAVVLLVAVLAAGAGPAAAQSTNPRVEALTVGNRRPSPPPDARGKRVLREAAAYRGLKILVSTEDRWLWLVNGRDTLMSVPVAVGMGEAFEFEDKRFFFETPRGRRRVLKKEPNPIWTVPEWHYLERAKSRGFGVVRLDSASSHLLSDGSFITVMGGQVGRLNQFGNFYAFEPGTEVMFDSLVFVPPMGTPQRAVPDALGPYKLDTGDGYLIHGTHIYNEESVGEAVSHGCVRMTNADLEVLYQRVPVGTPVFIF